MCVHEIEAHCALNEFFKEHKLQRKNFPQLALDNKGKCQYPGREVPHAEYLGILSSQEKNCAGCNANSQDFSWENFEQLGDYPVTPETYITYIDYRERLRYLLGPF